MGRIRKGKKKDRNTLWLLLIFNVIIIIPIFSRKPPIKDWLLVYLFNALTNVVLDNILSKFKVVEYPHRFLPKLFDGHVLFDLLLYPTMTVFYNQVTQKDKPLAIIYKLFFFTVPMFLIEFWAEKRTNLIDWRRKWKWYYTFLSITIKSLLTRSFIGLVRKIDEKQKTLP